MTAWQPKVFWKTVAVTEVEGGFAVTLDGRQVKTPNKQPLILPSRGVAQLVADEWAAQEGTVKPATMPATRMANSALEKVVPQHDEVAALLAEYGGSDLLCYRADGPAALAERQAAAWDPLLDWAEAAFGTRLAVTAGIMPVAQDPAAVARLAAEVQGMGPFHLAAFYDLVSISGSLVIALAVVHGVRDPEAAWDISRIDNAWQAEMWGPDDEEIATAAFKRAAFLFAARFHALV